MAEAAADIGALDIVEVVARLTEELVAIIFPVFRVTTAVGRTVPAQVIHQQRGRGEGGRLPGQATLDKAVVILGMIVLTLAALNLAGETVGQGVTAIQRTAQVQTRFLVIKGAVGDVALTNTFEARPLADEVDRAARVCRTKQRGVGTAQHLDALIGKGLLADATHRAQGQAVTVSGGLEAADLEVVVAVIGTVIIGDHPRRVLQYLFGGAGAALLYLFLGDDRNGGRGIEHAGRHLATNPELLGHHRVGIIISCDLGVDDNRSETEYLVTRSTGLLRKTAQGCRSQRRAK